MDYAAPKSLDDAFPILDARTHAIVAGGTDFFPSLGDGPPPQDILDVSGLPELHGITRLDGGWRIGGGVSWTDVIRAPLPPAFGALKAAAREVGSIQIQNAGTVAGNICNASPAADGIPPLLVLDASVELASSRGVRTVPLESFVTGVRQVALNPGELVTAIHVPAAAAETRSAFRKLGSRKYLVISIAMVAVALGTDDDCRISDVRIAIGACSPVARRLAALEQSLVGLQVKDDGDLPPLEPVHFSGLSPISDMRGSADFRSSVVTRLTRSVILRALFPEASGHA